MKKDLYNGRMPPSKVEERTYNDFLIDYDGRTANENKHLVELQLYFMQAQRSVCLWHNM